MIKRHITKYPTLELRPGELTKLAGIVKKKYHQPFSVLGVSKSLNRSVVKVRLSSGFTTEITL